MTRRVDRSAVVEAAARRAAVSSQPRDGNQQLLCWQMFTHVQLAG